MNQTQITIGKRLLDIYWLSVVVAALFLNSTFGYYYVLGGILVLFAHFIEMFVFEKTIKEYSTNLMRDRLMVLPYGLLVPNELKLKDK